MAVDEFVFRTTPVMFKTSDLAEIWINPGMNPGWRWPEGVSVMRQRKIKIMSDMIRNSMPIDRFHIMSVVAEALGTTAMDDDDDDIYSA